MSETQRHLSYVVIGALVAALLGLMGFLWEGVDSRLGEIAERGERTEQRVIAVQREYVRIMAIEFTLISHDERLASIDRQLGEIVDELDRITDGELASCVRRLLLLDGVRREALGVERLERCLENRGF